MDLSGRVLAAVDFTGAKIMGCKFDKAMLSAGRFNNTKISYSSFAGADLRAAILNGADIRYCEFPGADFSELDLREGRLRIRAEVNGAVFVGCNLKSAKLHDTQIRQADIRLSSR